MKKLVKLLLGKLRNKLRRSVDPDIYVLSYPKSGRTWLRVLIGKYLSLKYNLPEDEILSTEFMSTSSGLPRVKFSHDGTGQNIAKPYEQLSRDKQEYTDKKVILLGRDIKDTLVSGYFHATKRKEWFEGTISEFIRSAQFGVPKSFLFIRYLASESTCA